jgi:hypothetical protein
MKTSALVLVVAAALSFVMTSPASGATPDPHASCAGLANASRAGDPGAQAQVVHDVLAEAFYEGHTPGSNFSDFAIYHLGTSEACLA